MAAIYLSKCESELGAHRNFHIGDKPLLEIADPFGIRPEACEPSVPLSDAGSLQKPDTLFVFVTVREEEAKGTAFEAGYYRATLAPHLAVRHCHFGLSDLLGDAPTGA
jgi:hypothetical protein